MSGAMNFKKCSVCGEEKAESSFSAGRMQCKPCRSNKAKEWYRNNPDKVEEKKAERIQTTLEWQKRNRAFLSARAKEKYRQNPAKVIEATRRWQKANRDKVAAVSASRRSAQANALPSWADMEKIRELYAVARRERKHVDHIVPLKSKIVCGLHCEANLRILDPKENRIKNNRYWPDMP